MGVNGLWTLISPVARPIKLETMGNKKLAIDSSIWLYQFQNAMRDREGRALTNAHILGFLRRICKLLYYGIKPVFVFDGGAPVLKRITIGDRKKRKRGGQENLAKTAEKLLAAQMRQAAVKEAQRRAEEADTGDVIADDAQYLDDTQDFINVNVVRRKDKDRASASPVQEKAPSPEVPKKKKYVPKDQYALPALDASIQSSAQPSDPRLATEAELRDFIEDMHPEDFDMDSEVFQHLPTEVKYEIIGDLRIKSRQQNWKRVQEMRSAPTALDFSKAQIRNLMERNDLTQKLLSVTDMISKANLTIPVKIASQRNREYLLVKNDAEHGGGWVLGVRDGVMTNPRAPGTKASPVKIDGSTTEDDSVEGGNSSATEEFEEVQVPKSSPAQKDKSHSPDPEYRHRQTLRAIRQRYGGPVEEPQGPYDPDLDAPVVEGLSDATGLFGQPEAVDDDEAVMREIAAEVEAYEMTQRGRQAGAGEEEDSDESAEFEEVPPPPAGPSASFAGPRAGPSGTRQNDVSVPPVSSANRTTNGKPQVRESVKEVGRNGVPSAVAAALEGAEDDSEDDDAFEEVDGAPPPKHREPTPASVSAPVTAAGTVGAPKPVPVRSAPPAASSVRTPATQETDFVDPRLAKSRSQAKRVVRNPSPPRPPEPIELESSSSDEADDEQEGSRPRKKPRSSFSPPSHSPVGPDPAPEVPTDIVARDFAASSVAPDWPSGPRAPLPMVEALRSAKEDLAIEAVQELGPDEGPRPPLSAGPTPAKIAVTQLEDRTAAPEEPIAAAADEEEEEYAWSRSPTPVPRRDPSPMNLEEATKDFPLAPIGHELDEEEEMPDEDAEVAANIQQESSGWSDFLSQLQNRNLDDLRAEVDAEVRNLTDQRTKDRRGADDITVQMSKEIQVMLRLFGIPYVVAPMEAEAQCAELLSRSLVDGIITDDSDVFLFGGSRIYKNMFNQNKYVECYLLSDLERELSLDREKLVRLAYILGSDYVDGLPGVGPVGAMEVMREFPGTDGLMTFRDWWRKVQTGKDGEHDNVSPFRRKFRKNKDRIWLEENWPNPAVLDAYYHPTVDESDQRFVWGIPDLDGLRQFLMENLSWSSNKTDDLLIPLIRRQTQRIGGIAHTQGVLDGFFDISAGSGTYAPRQRTGYSSQRLQNIVKEWREAQKKQKAIEDAAAANEDEEEEDRGAPVREELLGKRQGRVKPVVRRLPALSSASASTASGVVDPSSGAVGTEGAEGSTSAQKGRKRARPRPSAGAVAASARRDGGQEDTSAEAVGESAAPKAKKKTKRVSFAPSPSDDEARSAGQGEDLEAADSSDSDEYVERPRTSRRGRGRGRGRGSRGGRGGRASKAA